MKPKTTITKKKSIGSSITSDLIQAEIQQVSHLSIGKQWKWRTRFLIGLAALVIILTVVTIGVVFLRKHLSTDIIRTFHLTYKTKKNDVASETISVSATEVKFQLPGVADAVLDFDKTFQVMYKTKNNNETSETISVSATEVKFQLPGVADAVFDFDKGLSMYKRLDEERSSCFLTTFNASERMAPKELKEYLEKTQGTNEAEREIHNCYKATNFSITNRNFLSPITRDMCNNVEIFWMINEDCSNLLHGRQNRATVSVSFLWGLIEFTISWE